MRILVKREWYLLPFHTKVTFVADCLAESHAIFAASQIDLISSEVNSLFDFLAGMRHFSVAASLESGLTLELSGGEAVRLE